jgi:hypothetical protein
MECFYGVAYLCKVGKRDPVDSDALPAFDVVSICNEIEVVNMFFDEFVPDVDAFVSVFHFITSCVVSFFVSKLNVICIYPVSQIGDPALGASRELSDGHNVYHSSCESFESANFAGDFIQSPNSVDGQVGHCNVVLKYFFVIRIVLYSIVNV